MICCWENLLGILPAWMKEDVNRLGKETLQELRLRMGQAPELILSDGHQWLKKQVCQADLNFCINTATRYSPWAASTIADGYVTANGGHRIGICGQAFLKDGAVGGIREPDSLCIRVARDFPGIAKKAENLTGSVLILGAPGWGKTTLLRDLIRIRSDRENVAAVDERGELFPEGFSRGLQTDILKGCPKAQGILQVLRTMGPDTIAADEITAEEDCRAILNVFACGISLLTTAHSSSVSEFRERKLYRKLIDAHVFQHAVVLRKDQTYALERMEQ